MLVLLVVFIAGRSSAQPLSQGRRCWVTVLSTRTARRCSSPPAGPVAMRMVPTVRANWSKGQRDLGGDDLVIDLSTEEVPTRMLSAWATVFTATGGTAVARSVGPQRAANRLGRLLTGRQPSGATVAEPVRQ